MAERKNEIETKKTEMETKKESLWSEERIKLIKNTLAKDATPEEFRLFIELAKVYNLDPFKKQIFLIKNKNRPNDPATIMVSHAGMMHIAHESGKFGGMETYVITRDNKTALICNNDDVAGAVCYVYRTDWQKPLMHAVSFEEYYRKMPPGYKNIWDEKPITMIKKVAEAGALRRAFDTGGLYAAEEMDTEYVPINNEEEYQEEEQPKQVKKEVLRNNATLLAVIKRIEEAEKRFDVKGLKSTIEKKAGKKLEQMTERQLKHVLQLIDKYEAKKIKESMYTDADFIEEEPAQPEESQELGKPDDVDTIEERLKEIKQIFDD